MIPASDLWMLGLKPLRGVPTSGAAQPLRDLGELFPDWAARPSPDGDPPAPETGPARTTVPEPAARAGWRARLDAFIALAMRLAGQESAHGRG